MRLVRHGALGDERPGLIDPEGRVRDLSGHVADIAGPALAPDRLAALSALDPAALPLVPGTPQGDLRLGACVGSVGSFVGVGLNYADHAAETGAAIPDEPILFAKWTSCLAGPDDPLTLPPGSENTDWEVELGVVIGTLARRVPEAQALDHVAGYCLVNDVSEREWQQRRGGTWSKGKGFDGFGPVGPWLVTRDEIPDPQALHLWLDVDGVRMQDGHTGQMIFGVAALVAYVSIQMTLRPGDIISTGTPPGVGHAMRPPRCLRAGQTMRLGGDRLGVQTQRVLAG